MILYQPFGGTKEITRIERIERTHAQWENFYKQLYEHFFSDVPAAIVREVLASFTCPGEGHTLLPCFPRRCEGEVEVSL